MALSKTIILRVTEEDHRNFLICARKTKMEFSDWLRTGLRQAAMNYRDMLQMNPPSEVALGSLSTLLNRPPVIDIEVPPPESEPHSHYENLPCVIAPVVKKRSKTKVVAPSNVARAPVVRLKGQWKPE